jgi:hypothetical protein
MTEAELDAEITRLDREAEELRRGVGQNIN